MKTTSRKMSKKPGQVTLDQVVLEPGQKPEPAKLPAWFLDGVRKKQQATFLNARDTKAAQELFASEDKLKKIRSLVQTGAPTQKLFSVPSGAVNPKRRDSAVWDYFLWLGRKSHPEFEKNITNAVVDVNHFRKKMTPRSRAKFDYLLKKGFPEHGHDPEQFFIHFPEVHPAEDVFPREFSANSLSRKPSARKNNCASMPRVTD